MSNYYQREELLEMGFKHVGIGAKISKQTMIYNPQEKSIGDHSRVDDFCSLNGKIEIGNYVHITTYNMLDGGSAGLKIEDFVSIAFRCTIFTASDDYSGETLTNPLISIKFRTKIINKKIIIGKHSIIGTCTTIVPGMILGEGTAVMANSLIKRRTKPWSIYGGNPAIRIRERKKDLLELEKQFLKEQGENSSKE